MTLAWSSELTSQSSNYDDHRKLGFNFVDFLPECQDPGGFFKVPVYETFKTVIDHANNWLHINRKWKIMTCESVEFRIKRGPVNFRKMSYLEYAETGMWYIRGLRLWLMEQKEESDREQKIGYLNLIPKQVSERKIFKTASFETLDEVIQRFNTMQSHLTPGRVITVESQEMKLPNWEEFDPDCSIWVENGSMAKHYLFIIRIFYEVIAENPEEIGVKDFIPDKISSGGFLSLPEYEPFSNIIKKASDWYSQQSGIRFCNAQSLEIKLKRGKEFDTQKMNYLEHGSTSTFYLCILRVAFTRLPNKQYQINAGPSLFGHLTCKTFVPIQLTRGFFNREYEDLIKTKERICAWVKATGAHVASAETTSIRILSHSDVKHGTEVSFTYNMAKRNEYWIFIIRLYLHGVYNEPPPEMLPIIPEIENRGCCTII